MSLKAFDNAELLGEATQSFQLSLCWYTPWITSGVIDCCCAEFLENLFIRADFEGAQQKLKECEELIENDYFLGAMKAEFVENARWFIFENYCRIHQCIDLRMLAQNLGMPEEAAERWIVNLIRQGLCNIVSGQNRFRDICKDVRPSFRSSIVPEECCLCFLSLCGVKTGVMSCHTW